MTFSATRMRSASLVALALTQTPAAGGTQEPPLAAVLTRATHYVDQLQQELSGVVMEERYEQRSRVPPQYAGQIPRIGRATLLSDYLLVQPRGSERHFGFRDVFAVNGRAVRDREQRLTELFLNRSASVDLRIEGIVADSARYNVGDVERNINTPTMALLFLSSAYKHRFDFRRGRDTATSLGIDAPGRGLGLWVVDYEETGSTTVIRGQDDQRLPVRGRYWIEPATGRVFLSELVLDTDSPRGSHHRPLRGERHARALRAGRDARALPQSSVRVSHRGHGHVYALPPVPGARRGICAVPQLSPSHGCARRGW